VDDRDVVVPGAVDVRAALRLDPLYRVAGSALTSPYVLGVVFALLAVVTIVFGTSTESRFIYTDF
jgi:uncharacterized protein (DUF697 family)